MTHLLRFLNILMAGLVAGTIFGIWLGYNPVNLSAAAYIEQHQAAVGALNTLMPILGFITIILTLTSAIIQKKNKTVFISLLIATCLFIVSGLVTKFGNQPINSIVMTWSESNTPANWSELRDTWWSYHIIRTISAVIAFVIVIWSGIRKD
jgi:hypothetical protein